MLPLAALHYMTFPFHFCLLHAAVHRWIPFKRLVLISAPVSNGLSHSGNLSWPDPIFLNAFAASCMYGMVGFWQRYASLIHPAWFPDLYLRQHWCCNRPVV